MSDAFLVDGLRSPFGKFRGSLSEIHPADLAADTITALLDRVAVDPARIEDVILGCVNQIGPQTSCIARTAWLTAGLPESVPGVTVDRRCGSSLQAVHFAAQAVMAGVADLVLAGGVESMSAVPIGSPRQATVRGQDAELPGPFATDRWQERYGPDEPSQFYGADLVADRWNISVEELNDYSANSHVRAAAAWEEGRFEEEVVPLPTLTVDECIRHPVDRTRMASLTPLRDGGRITAAMSSQISDGATMVLIASEAAVREHSLSPLARFNAMTLAGDDPIIMLTAPIESSRRALERAGLSSDEIGLVEINEAFASVPLAIMRELKFDESVVNVNGGAIALGHPLGATGARLILTLARELARRRDRYGLATLCEAGGQANTTILERV